MCSRGREKDVVVDIAAKWDWKAGTTRVGVWAGRGRSASYFYTVTGYSTEVSRAIAGGSVQFHPSGLTLSGKWDSRWSGQYQPCIRESTTLLGGG